MERRSYRDADRSRLLRALCRRTGPAILRWLRILNWYLGEIRTPVRAEFNGNGRRHSHSGLPEKNIAGGRVWRCSLPELLVYGFEGMFRE